ncbi:MAG TPA: hypothetical protein VEK38_01975 [Candidatus Bathyarchaeia archaeon]|nr:hypothetical protein [Candidatus Bathyarchaeia archaeon]
MKVMHLFIIGTIFATSSMMYATKKDADKQKEDKVTLSVDEAEKVEKLLKFLLRAPREAGLSFMEVAELESLMNNDGLSEELFIILGTIEKQLKGIRKSIKHLKHDMDESFDDLSSQLSEIDTSIVNNQDVIIGILGNPETDGCIAIPEDTTPEQIEELTAGASLVSLIKTVICELHGF